MDAEVALNNALYAHTILTSATASKHPLISVISNSYVTMALAYRMGLSGKMIPTTSSFIPRFCASMSHKRAVRYAARSKKNWIKGVSVVMPGYVQHLFYTENMFIIWF